MSDITCRSMRPALWPAVLSIFFGLTVLLPVCFATDVEVTMFGPKQYVLTTDYNIYSDSFRGVSGQGEVIIQNGDGNGNNLVKTAVVLIDGVPIFDSSKGNQPGYTLEAPIWMDEENSISVWLYGEPGSYITVQAAAEITPDATSTQVIGIAGGTVSVQNHLGDILTLEIPPLALEEDTPISASALPNPLPSPIAQNLYPGAVLQPEGLYFSLPVKITVSLHDTLTNPNMSLLFYLKDSSLALPIANQNETQDTIEGESYHFSTILGAVPTWQEIATTLNTIQANPIGSLQTVLDMVTALVTFAGKCQLTGDDELATEARGDADDLAETEAEALVKTTLPGNPCSLNTLFLVQFAIDLQGLGLDSLADEFMYKACSFTVSPPSLTFVPWGPPQPLTAQLIGPDGSQRSCSELVWFSTNESVAKCISTSGMSCQVAPITETGTTDISADCDGLPATAPVLVTSDQYGGTIVATGSVVDTYGDVWGITEQYDATVTVYEQRALMTLNGSVSWVAISCVWGGICTPSSVPVSSSTTLVGSEGSFSGTTEFCYLTSCIDSSITATATASSFAGTWSSVWSGYSTGSYSAGFSLSLTGPASSSAVRSSSLRRLAPNITWPKGKAGPVVIPFGKLK